METKTEAIGVTGTVHPGKVDRETEDWDLVLDPEKSLWSLNLKSIWRYRDLLMLFVRRDFVSLYKQTILGPLWFIIQPIVSTLIFTVIFGKVANISTDGIPQPVFYLSGLVLWNYFAECLTKTSETFITNQTLFGKVFFPRLVVPLSVVVSSMLKLLVQFGLLVVFYLYYLNTTDVAPNATILLVPVLVAIMAGIGLAGGLIVTSLTTKYRDLKFLIQFGVQLMMYASPIVYPLSILPDKYRILMILNPVTGVIETFRYALFSEGYFSWGMLGYSFGFTVVFLLIGIAVFNRVEKTFIDTV